MELVTAYIPCYNNVNTIAAAVQSLKEQTVHVDEIIVVDDGSKDDSAKVAEAAGARVIILPQNMGRGAARSRAMEEAKHEFVLCLDGTNRLPADFLEKSLIWFKDEKVSAAYGLLIQNNPRNLAERWRGRHLFRQDEAYKSRRNGLLTTYGALVRKSHVMQVGNYNPALRHSEDRELGYKLRFAGLDVIFDPELLTHTMAQNTLFQVLERYWRWNAGTDEEVSWIRYIRESLYSVKVLAAKDMRAGDYISVPVSLFVPHYQFWKSWWRHHFPHS